MLKHTFAAAATALFLAAPLAGAPALKVLRHAPGNLFRPNETPEWKLEINAPQPGEAQLKVKVTDGNGREAVMTKAQQAELKKLDAQIAELESTIALANETYTAMYSERSSLIAPSSAA